MGRVIGSGWVRAVAVLAVLAVAAPAGRADIIPPGGSYLGYSYNDLEVLWWQTILTIPVGPGGDHPFLTGEPVAGPPGILFLTGTAAGSPAIDLTISADTALFLAVANAEASAIEPPPFFGATEAERRAAANAFVDASSGRFAEIDGVSVPDLDAYRTDSPEFLFGPLPADNLFAFFGLPGPVGYTGPSVAAGYWLLLTPLSPGEHTISSGVTFGLPPGEFATTYNIRVTSVPEPASLALAGLGAAGLVGAARRRRARRG
ncbi:MAG: PEP-CTERM sorting domain-containing protein [Gemmataceae bacterium]|nr:PEP-CTERM sorting domain-containing protein [Gemmataceae bacterium]